MTMRRSAVAFAGASRVHIGLEVRDLERSLAFYRVLLGEEPTKVRPGYAKFEPREPSVNLSLNEGAGGRVGAGSQHFGLQVQTSAAVQAMAARFQAAGIPTRLEEGSACCHSVQDKVWAVDPDGNPWEVFVVVEADSPHRAPVGATCCVPRAEGSGEKSCCG
jgi:catechol 2,3-dioxygenase-like lactoylglutathione lyase family enzyme